MEDSKINSLLNRDSVITTGEKETIFFKKFGKTSKGVITDEKIISISEIEIEEIIDVSWFLEIFAMSIPRMIKVGIDNNKPIPKAEKSLNILNPKK